MFSFNISLVFSVLFITCSTKFSHIYYKMWIKFLRLSESLRWPIAITFVCCRISCIVCPGLAIELFQFLKNYMYMVNAFYRVWYIFVERGTDNTREFCLTGGSGCSTKKKCEIMCRPFVYHTVLYYLLWYKTPT